MKSKLIICIVAFVFSINAFGQTANPREGENNSPKEINNEVKLNLLTAVIGLPEIDYERYIADNMGVGLAVAIAVDKVENLTIRSMVLPYARIYFGQKRASGFFIEGNMVVAGIKNRNYAYAYDNLGYYNYVSDYYTSETKFGCGVAAGFKFLTRNGFTGEIYLGGGRLFGDSDPGGYPRVGLCIGKRF